MISQSKTSQTTHEGWWTLLTKLIWVFYWNIFLPTDRFLKWSVETVLQQVSGWKMAFIFISHTKSELFLVRMLLFCGAWRMCVCSSQRFSVGLPCSCWQHLTALDGVAVVVVGGASEWEGVTAVKHLSGSLPPLLFKCRHAFAHKDTNAHTHVGMCRATFSDDIREVNTAAAGNPHQHTPTHGCLQDIWEASPLLLGPLLHPCWCAHVPSCCTVRRW